VRFFWTAYYQSRLQHWHPNADSCSMVPRSCASV